MDYKRDDSAVSKSNALIVTNRGVRDLRQTTIGRKLLIQWKDGSKDWTPFKILKESNPAEVAEFVVTRGISYEPKFSWWVPFFLKKRDRIIDTANSRLIKKTHKFGIEVPMSIQHTKLLDAKNGFTLRQDAIAKDMYQVLVYFKILEDG